MGPWSVRRRAISFFLTGAAIAWPILAPGSGSSQQIAIRTVPVAQSHQFDFLPSQRSGMAGVSLALRDSLLDPFVNPATGARSDHPGLFSSPGVYSVTSQAGAGRTLPFGGLGRSGDWFGAVAVSLQQVDPGEVDDGFGPQPFIPCSTCGPSEVDLSRGNVSEGNQYVLVSLGRDLPWEGLSVGASFHWADLSAVDGVDLLYAGSSRIVQDGGSIDLRLGALKEWGPDHALEVVALHSRFDMRHDVWYSDPVWDPARQRVAQRPRLEENLDRTNSWGLHAEYERPFSTEGWRLGGVATVNYKNHPKIPNYEIMNIPRDPGSSYAYNLGAGVARAWETSTFGVDLIYEPIWSHTWADAESATENELGEVIPAGGKTIENWFRFSNWKLRLGISEEVEVADARDTVVGLQLGLALLSTDYSLEQRDHVQRTDRSLVEQWWEWTPTWGITFRRPSLEIRYRGQVSHGTGRPGVANQGRCFDVCFDAAVANPGSNILVAPSGPLTLDPVRVIVNQISVSIPLGRDRFGGAPDPVRDGGGDR